MFEAVERVAYLSKLAKEKPELRFKDLYQVICRVEFLEEAYERIKENAGSKTAGVDGVNKFNLFNKAEPEKVFATLADELRNESYKPLPVRRVEINGGKRPLGIPALKDRIVQSAVKLILEGIFENDFSECSHGFRPNRACQTAINEIIVRKFDWVIEGDIRGCFDNINHGKLLNIIRKRIADEKFINLINNFLKSGYQMGYGPEGKVPVFETKDGTPQGGIVSPILANIYLNEFDKFMETKLHSPSNPRDTRDSEYMFYENRIGKLEKAIREGKYPIKSGHFEEIEGRKQKKRVFVHFNTRDEAAAEVIRCKKIRSTLPQLSRNKWFEDDRVKGMHCVRYADDFVILLTRYNKEFASNLKTEISKWFSEELALTLSQEKTHITHSTKGFRFLGYDILHEPSKNGFGYQGTFAKVFVPSDKRNVYLEKIDDSLRAGHDLHPFDMFQQLNRITNGWGNYYRIVNNWSVVAKELNHKVFWKVLHWLGRKYKKQIPQIMKEFYRHSVKFDRKGLIAISGDVAKKECHMKHLNDIKYDTPSNISRKIKAGSSFEGWHTSENDTTHIGLKQAFSKGYSMADNVETLAKGNYQCAKCGGKVTSK